MSYVVLARKYRPRVFAELVGQAHVVQALSNALVQQRLHHAYLFTGTRGVGKTTISRILAKSLNCTGADGQGGITAEPCGVCAACRDIDAGRHVDYIELDAASNRGVDEISQLLDQAVYKPVVGRFKVYMIDEVHMLSSTAFNAMLKTLEEPPDYLKFVLATTDPQKVPVTVLSRCLQFNLRPMAPETVQEHLVHVLASEGIAAEPGALRLLARAARGSMRDALSLSDQAIAFGGGRLEEATVRQMLGAVDRGHAVRIIEAVAAGDGAALLAQVDELRLQGLSAGGTLEELMRLAQEMAVAQALPQALDAGDPDAAQVARLAGRLAPDETQLLYSVALHGRAELALAPDEYSGLSMVLLRLLAFKPGEGAGARVPRGEGAGAAAPGSPATAPAGAAPVRPGEGAAAGHGTQAPGQAAPAAPRSAGLAHAPAVARAATPVPAPVPTPVPTPSPPHAAREGVRRAESAEPPPWEDVPDAEPGAAARPSSGAAQEEPPPWVDEGPDDIVSTRATAGASAVQAGASMRSEPPVTPTALPTVEPDPATDRWLAWIEPHWRSGVLTALARELAWQAQCVDGEAGAPGAASRWVLRVARETLRQDAVRDRLQAALAQASGAPVQLQVEAGEVRDSAALRDALAKAAAQAAAEDVIRNDPLVQSLLSEFKTARIVPGSVRPL